MILKKEIKMINIKKKFLEEKRPTEGRERGPKEPIPAYER